MLTDKLTRQSITPRKNQIMKTLKNLAAKFNNAARKFDQDQDGMETMQIVMIIAVAAIVLIFVRGQWDAISGWAEGLVGDVISWH